MKLMNWFNKSSISVIIIALFSAVFVLPLNTASAVEVDLSECSLDLDLYINGKLNVNTIILRSTTDKYTLQAKIAPATSASGCFGKIYWRITSQDPKTLDTALTPVTIKTAMTEKLPFQTTVVLSTPKPAYYNYAIQVGVDKNFTEPTYKKIVSVKFSNDQQEVLDQQKPIGGSAQAGIQADDLTQAREYAGKDWTENLSIKNPLSEDGKEITDISQLATKLINWLLLILGLIATAMIIYAGVLLVFNGGNESQVKKAKTILTWSIIGLVVSLSAFAIVNMVQSLLG